jgi:hypothetical protein
MSGRYTTLGRWIEKSDGSESYAELDVYVTASEPETRYEPYYAGDVTPERLRIDGDDVDMYPAHAKLVRRILDLLDHERIPEGRTEEDA